MDEQLLNQAYKFKECLDNDERLLLLSKLDEEINNNEEVIKLASIAHKLQDEYELQVRCFGEDSESSKKVLHDLSIAKKNLDEHPLVLKYNQAFKEVRRLYERINDELFSKIKGNKHICLE